MHKFDHLPHGGVDVLEELLVPGAEVVKPLLSVGGLLEAVLRIVGVFYG